MTAVLTFRQLVRTLAEKPQGCVDGGAGYGGSGYGGSVGKETLHPKAGRGSRAAFIGYGFEPGGQDDRPRNSYG